MKSHSQTDKIKIVQVITRLNVGGAAVYNILLTRYLKKKGYDSKLIKGSESSQEGYLLDITQNYEEEKLHVFLPELTREIRPAKDLLALYKLIRLFLKEKPELVHTHTAKAGFLGRIAAMMARVPVRIHTFHGHVFSGYFGKIKSRFFLIFEQILGRTTDRIFTETKSLRDELIAFNIAKPKKIHVIPLGLDLDQFTDIANFKGILRRRLGLSDDVVVIGNVSRLVPIKRVDVFLKSAKHIIETCKKKLHFVIVGDGELRNELETLTQKLDLHKQVTFTGFWRDLREVYADIDIVVLSSANEGCPVSIIEAMASGKPVVATAVGGVKDVIRHGENGFLAPMGDHHTLAENILQLINTPNECHRLAAKGQKSVFENHTIQKSVDLTEQHYLELLKVKNF